MVLCNVTHHGNVSNKAQKDGRERNAYQGSNCAEQCYQNHAGSQRRDGNILQQGGNAQRACATARATRLTIPPARCRAAPT